MIKAFPQIFITAAPYILTSLIITQFKLKIRIDLIPLNKLYCKDHIKLYQILKSRNNFTINQSSSKKSTKFMH